MQLQRLELVYPIFLACRTHLESRLSSWRRDWDRDKENAIRLARHQVSDRDSRWDRENYMAEESRIRGAMRLRELREDESRIRAAIRLREARGREITSTSSNETSSRKYVAWHAKSQLRDQVSES